MRKSAAACLVLPFLNNRTCVPGSTHILPLQFMNNPEMQNAMQQLMADPAMRQAMEQQVGACTRLRHVLVLMVAVHFPWQCACLTTPSPHAVSCR